MKEINAINTNQQFVEADVENCSSESENEVS